MRNGSARIVEAYHGRYLAEEEWSFGSDMFLAFARNHSPGRHTRLSPPAAPSHKGNRARRLAPANHIGYFCVNSTLPLSLNYLCLLHELWREINSREGVHRPLCVVAINAIDVVVCLGDELGFLLKGVENIRFLLEPTSISNEYL